jgi:hypothetical protein
MKRKKHPQIDRPNEDHLFPVSHATLYFKDNSTNESQPVRPVVLVEAVVEANAIREWLDAIKETGASSETKSSLATPPGFGDFLIVMFAPKRRVDFILGDLTERFADEVGAIGRRRAQLRFWGRVLRSIWPLLWVKIRKGGFLAILFEIGRRWTGS